MRPAASPHWIRSSLFALAFALGTATSHAQEGFAIDRFDPSERGSDWFANESLDIRGHLRPAVGLVGEWAYKPLVLYDANGDETAAIIEHQLFVHVGASLILFERLRLAANLPLAVFQQGEAGTVANASFDSSDATTVGDARLGADVRIAGEYRDPASLAAGVQVYLPSGDQDAFAGDGKVRVQPRLMLAGDIGKLAYAAKLGLMYRANDDDLAGVPKGSEVTFSAALGARAIDDKLIIGPEVYGSTVVRDTDRIFDDRRQTPLEAVLGAHYRFLPDWRAGLGAGPGLTRGYGSPQVRVLASIEWFPEIEKEAAPPPPPDTDGDGVLDSEDACPTVPGVRTDDPKTNGCPAAPNDRDGDGIVDEKDACPDQPGPKSDDPAKNGCPPPPDRDGDGIIDPEDACPDQPGPKSDDPAKNGCPPPPDRDGIIDPEDACPDTPGPKNEDPKKNGCPIARIERGQIRITERVEFQYNSATIRPESEQVLDAVLQILRDHPEITKVSVEGHTDSKGPDAYNKALSKRRAASVVKWLTGKGVAAKRLESKGLGEERPIDDNQTEEGRQNNRRVEFHILELDGKKVDAEGKPLSAVEKPDAPAPKK